MYPVNLKVEGIPCLVIGGGHIALRKIRKLLKEKALITVLAPEACSEIGDMAVNKDIQWEKRTYTANDWNGYQIVITAAGRRDVADSFIMRQTFQSLGIIRFRQALGLEGYR